MQSRMWKETPSVNHCHQKEKVSSARRSDLEVPVVYKLNDFNRKVIDGLEFCRGIQEFLRQLQEEPKGSPNVLDRERREKKVIEELYPIQEYVKACYEPFCWADVEWHDGSQPYDAVLHQKGKLVDEGFRPKKLFLEVTVACHKDDHLARHELALRGYSFGPGKIKKNRQTGVPESTPCCFEGVEPASDLADLVIDRIKAKAEKKHEQETVLIVTIHGHHVLLPDEWHFLVDRVRSKQPVHGFKEIFLTCGRRELQAFLFGPTNEAPVAGAVDLGQDCDAAR